MLKFFLIFFSITLQLSLVYSSELHWQGEAENKFFVEIRISSNEISLQDNLNVDLSIKYPPTHTVDIHTLKTNLLKHIEFTAPPFAIINEQKTSDESGSIQIHFALEPQFPGKQYLSFYNIVFLPEDKSASSVEIISDIFEVNVLKPLKRQPYQPVIAPLLSLTEEYPITLSFMNRKELLQNPKKSIQEAKSNMRQFQSKTFPWREFFALIFFSIVVIIIKFQNSKDRYRKAKPINISLIKNKEIQALEHLKEKSVKFPQEREKFYVQITNLVRTFIEETFQIKTSVVTTPDFLLEITQSSKLDQNQKSLLSKFIISADQVKFAKHLPSQEECNEAYHAAKSIIEHSTSER